MGAITDYKEGGVKRSPEIAQAPGDAFEYARAHPATSSNQTRDKGNGF